MYNRRNTSLQCPQVGRHYTYMNTETLCPWLDDTLDLVKKVPRDVSLTDIAISSAVPLTWLSKFVNGKFKTPNIFYVYRLHQYLITLDKV